MAADLKHFLNLGLAVANDFILAEIDPAMWGAHPLRQNFVKDSPHRDATDIWLRWNEVNLLPPGAEHKMDTDQLVRALDDCEVVAYPAWAAMPYTRNVVLDLMRHVEGVRLGRVMLTRLPHGSKIHPHADAGAPAWYYERYHVVVGCGDGPNKFRIGDEWVDMRPGSVWWVNNEVEHEVLNESGADRIHLIVDIREDD